MNTTKSFSVRPAIIGFTIATFSLAIPYANAYMLVTYQTDEMSWDREFSVESSSVDPVVFDSDFLYWRRVKFDISFMTPDFELVMGEEQHITFNDPSITVNAHSLAGDDFVNPLVVASGSSISFHVYPDETPTFSFSIKFSEVGNPSDSVFSYGSLDSWGGLEPADPYPVNYDEFMIKQFDWPYSRHDQTWYFDTTSYFVDANYNKMTIEKISLPEPNMPTLLITGLALTISLRKFRHSNRKKLELGD